MGDDPPPATDSVSYDPGTETFRATFDSVVTPPSIAVVEVLATVRDCEPTDLDPLYEAVDPEALDRLLTVPAAGPDAGDRTVTFAFADHEVTVLSCGLVKVRPLEPTGVVAEE